MNIKLATKLIHQLAQNGVNEFVICAGARNAPIVKVLYAAKNLKHYNFFEERSAGFFALGRIKKTRRPVAVITTSGTAVANLYPSVMEAHHAGLPLVTVTADRPKHYRGSGAPQSTNQQNVFGAFSDFLDVDVDGLEGFHIEKLGPMPLQINICFDEPLIDEEAEKTNFEVNDYSYPVNDNSNSEQLFSFQQSAKYPVVIVSHLTREQANFTLPIIDKLKLPVYVESHSNMPRQPFSQLMGGEFTLKQVVKSGLIDSVIRVGGIPTIRFWRDLEKLNLPVLNFSAENFSGLGYVKSAPQSIDSLKWFLENKVSNGNYDEIMRVDQQRSKRLMELIEQFPESEVALLNETFKQIGEEDQVFIGNSMAIRELDLVQGISERFPRVYSQRGLNGIDGLISTGLGVCDEKSMTWIIVGDLSALYDSTGLWPAIRNPKFNYKIVVINNSGGKIFQRVFDDPDFENRHGLQFQKLAEFWGQKYCQVRNSDEFSQVAESNFIEILPDNFQSKSFWESL